MKFGGEQASQLLGTQFYPAGQAFRPRVPNFPLFPPFVELPHNAMLLQPRGWPCGDAIQLPETAPSRHIWGYDWGYLAKCALHKRRKSDVFRPLCGSLHRSIFLSVDGHIGLENCHIFRIAVRMPSHDASYNRTRLGVSLGLSAEQPGRYPHIWGILGVSSDGVPRGGAAADRRVKPERDDGSRVHIAASKSLIATKAKATELSATP